MAGDGYLIHHVSVCQRGPSGLQKCSRVSSHAGDVTCLVRASTRPSFPQLLLLHVCIETSGECVHVKAVCQRGCLSEGGIITPIGTKESGMPRLLMSLRIIYCLCMLWCLCVLYKSYLPACMRACTHCGPEWTSCCALHGSLARSVETRN
jgi:hypothetical protein